MQLASLLTAPQRQERRWGRTRASCRRSHCAPSCPQGRSVLQVRIVSASTGTAGPVAAAAATFRMQQQRAAGYTPARHRHKERTASRAAELFRALSSPRRLPAHLELVVADAEQHAHLESTTITIMKKAHAHLVRPAGLPTSTARRDAARHELSVELARRCCGGSREKMAAAAAAGRDRSTARCRVFASQVEPGGQRSSVQVPCDDTSKRRLIAGTKGECGQSEATCNRGPLVVSDPVSGGRKTHLTRQNAVKAHQVRRMRKHRLKRKTNREKRRRPLTGDADAAVSNERRCGASR